MMCLSLIGILIINPKYKQIVYILKSNLILKLKKTKVKFMEKPFFFSPKL